MIKINKAIDRIESGNPNLVQAIRDTFGYKNRTVNETQEIGYLECTTEVVQIAQGTVKFTLVQNGDFTEFFTEDRGDIFISIFDINFDETLIQNYNFNTSVYDPNTDKTTVEYSFGGGNVPSTIFTTAYITGIKSVDTLLDFDTFQEVTNIVDIFNRPQLFKEITIGSLKGIDFRIAEILNAFMDDPRKLPELVEALPGKYAKIKRVFKISSGGR